MPSGGRGAKERRTQRVVTQTLWFGRGILLVGFFTERKATDFYRSSLRPYRTILAQINSCNLG